MPLAAYLDIMPTLGTRVFAHASCQIIGEVSIGDDCSIWCNAVLRGDVNRIAIGRGRTYRISPWGMSPTRRRASPTDRLC